MVPRRGKMQFEVFFTDPRHGKFKSFLSGNTFITLERFQNICRHRWTMKMLNGNNDAVWRCFFHRNGTLGTPRALASSSTYSCAVFCVFSRAAMACSTVVTPLMFFSSDNATGIPTRLTSSMMSASINQSLFAAATPFSKALIWLSERIGLSNSKSGARASLASRKAFQ